VGLLVLTAALIPLPVAASDAAAGTTTTTPTVKTSLRQAVANEAARLSKASIAKTPARRADQGSTGRHTATFFKTGPGIAVLSVMAIGAGYAIYSANHDRILSPGRK
jgi:hypothetical protein